MVKTQMNTRIDDLVKQQGDEAFAAIGWTPSHVVQVVWEIAAVDSTFPATLKEIAEKPQKSAELLCREMREEEALAGTRIIDRFYEKLGLHKPEGKEDIDYRALRERAFEERLLERGAL